MEKKTKITIGILTTILLVLTSILGYYKLQPKKETDTLKFQKEYQEVDKNHVFVYRNLNEIIDILKHGTGVVYLGFPECPWCQRYAVYLNEVAKEQGIEQIYYYNIKEDREKNTKEYQEVVKILEDSLDYNNEGKKRIFVPDITFVQDGKIIGHDNETSMISDENMTPDKYWDKENIKKLKEKLTKFASELNTDMCTKCNE